jgi:DNA polymerase V
MKKSFSELGKKTAEEEALTISGFPSPAADFFKKPLSVDDLLIYNPSSTFFFRYSGELSSSEIDFNEGDVLVVDRSKTPNKKTKYLIIEDQEGFHLISGKNFIQKIDNQKNININEFKNELIFGVVTALIRKY